MKLAISGKGGVGKTTLSSLLARIYASRGYQVLAIDANPDANFGAALGIPFEEVQKITPIVEMNDLIEERTGARPGTSAPFFKLNPKVDDIPDRFSLEKDGVKLLIMGTVTTGGSGCICPESTLLKALLSHLVLKREEVVILDMDAGIEHLGRGTVRAVNAFVVVVEPGQRSIQTAKSVRKLALDLGVERCYVVGNKIRSPEDEGFVRSNLPGFELLGFLNFNPKVGEADLKGLSVYDTAPEAVTEAARIVDRLEKVHGGSDGEENPQRHSSK
ncbi:carbon monoxide dehydrogenase accessory protein CooC [Dehalococcoidia bacterium]|nr:carbon monoxide dehydrogenase accessory protein CooC [Dehalococcoidia bacterium]